MILSDGMPQYVKMAEEMAVGGSLLGLTASDVLEVELHPRDFRDAQLGLVWWAIQNVAADGMQPTIPNVAHHLREGGYLDKMGGEPFLVELTADAYIYGNRPCAQAHAAIIREWAQKRILLRQASETARRVYENPLDAIEGMPDRTGEMPL